MVNAHTYTQLALRQPFPKWVVRMGGAVAHCEVVDDVLRVDYRGGITLSGFLGLDQAIQRLRKYSPVAIERMDSAFTVLSMDELVCEATWPPSTPPSAVIVRDDQYPFSVAFCAQLAQRGIVRMTFRQRDVARAERFVRLFQSAR